MRNPKKNRGKNYSYSLSKKLKKDGKSSDEFEIILNSLSLEEVIGLKLELATKSAFKGKMYGLPLWYSIPDIAKEAVLKYALSATRTQGEAARFLGLNVVNLRRAIKRHGMEEYFKKEFDKEVEMM